jgi:ABC-type branched-subunit amino acid transport system substrate-binding protein
MRGSGARWARRVAVVVAATLALAACGNSGGGEGASRTTRAAGGGARPVDQPGVTDTEIRVGGVASITNPINGPYGDACKGVQAYFDMVNAEGGVHGRTLRHVACRDDQMANNQREVEALLDQDQVFAVLPVATILSFSGARILAERKVPTFGWNIQKEWEGPENLFGDKGALCFGCPSVTLAWYLSRERVSKAGLLAYNVAQSANCVKGYEETFSKYPVAEVVFATKSLSFGQTDFSAEVKQMKDRGVDAVMPCVDQAGVLNLAKEMRKQGLRAVMWLPNAYDHAFMKQNGEFFAGSLVGVQSVPFETRPRPPGLAKYERWIRAGGYPRNELSMAGWINADLFVTGLRKAGPEFTRQKVIDALNTITDYRADGLISGIDWTVRHTRQWEDLDCAAAVRVRRDGTFQPVYGKPGKPYVCFPHEPARVPDRPVEYR